MSIILQIIGLIVGVILFAAGIRLDSIVVLSIGTLIIGFCLPTPKRP